jgi:excisionase family DNA binding protein
METPKYMTKAECAKYLRMSAGHLWLLTRHNKVPHVRITPKLIRYDREAIDKWLQNGGTAATSA